MSNAYLKQGDTGPIVVINLTDEDGAVIAITGLTLNLFGQKPGGAGAVTAATGGGGLTITNGAAGELEWAPAAGDMDTPGVLYFEVRVTYGDGRLETHPNNAAGFTIQTDANLQ